MRLQAYTKYILTAVICLFASEKVLAVRGGQDSGGGDAYEAEFKSIALDLFNEVSLLKPTKEQFGFEISAFEKALAEVQVFGSDSQIDFNGAQRTAINSLSQSLIVFNKIIWPLLDLRQKRLIVMHEYYRFLDPEKSEQDADYSRSTKVLSRIKKFVVLKESKPRPESPEITHERVMICQRLADSMTSPKAIEDARFACLRGQMESMSVDDCILVSNKMIFPKNKDSALKACLQGMASRLSNKDCSKIASSISYPDAKDEALAFCLQKNMNFK